jgi:hypothetical protein
LERGESDEDLGSDLSCQEDDGSSEPDDFELDWSSDEPSLSGHENNGNLPEVIIQLQKQLLNNYTLPPLLRSVNCSVQRGRRGVCPEC